MCEIKEKNKRWFQERHIIDASVKILTFFLKIYFSIIFDIHY